jgi:hypothetical protein
MASNVETVAQEALRLPSSGRALLVEKLLASLGGEVDPVVGRVHLVEIRERRSAVGSGNAMLINGPEGIQKARTALRF